MIKEKDIKMMEAQINEAIDESIKTNGNPDSPAVDALISEFTGPGTGLVWNAGNRTLTIAKGYCLDEDGNVVNPVDITGPATGLEYRDGRVVKVKNL